MVFLKLSAFWMRVVWRRIGEGGDEGVGVSLLEEGVAQFVLTEVARLLGDRLEAPVELGGWLFFVEAVRFAEHEAVWLEYEVWVRAVSVEASVTVLVPAGSAPPPGLEAWGSLEWPRRSASASSVRGRRNRVEPGDALVRTGGGRERACGERRWGAAWLHVGSTWHGGRFRLSEAGAKLHLDSTWRSAPGGERPMSDEHAFPPPATLNIEDLELLVTVELDRFPMTLAELQRWRPGEIVSLHRTPSDTVHLVMETGRSAACWRKGAWSQWATASASRWCGS
jgi:hypothetical protein